MHVVSKLMPPSDNHFPRIYEPMLDSMAKGKSAERKKVANHNQENVPDILSTSTVSSSVFTRGGGSCRSE